MYFDVFSANKPAKNIQNKEKNRLQSGPSLVQTVKVCDANLKSLRGGSTL